MIVHKMFVNGSNFRNPTTDLEKIAAFYNLRIHQYADDTQLYGHCSFDASMDLQVLKKF